MGDGAAFTQSKARKTARVATTSKVIPSFLLGIIVVRYKTLTHVQIVAELCSN